MILKKILVRGSLVNYGQLKMLSIWRMDAEMKKEDTEND